MLKLELEKKKTKPLHFFRINANLFVKNLSSYYQTCGAPPCRDKLISAFNYCFNYTDTAGFFRSGENLSATYSYVDWLIMA
ncbi:hypothetical protein BpHYR1_020575 [Brachionus plicatilis]|uniref:Uncharacterized protein n=1 Tax=Brachionus plicatilis TaxID=10195 RepID=A0A3M7QHK5_BRAPC|nr:hypothetical protein BpHYR1_020575 [Brachionus plicatilis]